MWRVGGGAGGRTKAPEQKSTVVKSFDELHSTPYPLIFLCAYCLFVYSNLEIFHIAVWIDQEWKDAVFLQYVLNLFEIISAKKHVLIFLSCETKFSLFLRLRGGGYQLHELSH